MEENIVKTQQVKPVITTYLELKVIDYFCTFEYLLGYEGIEFPSETSPCFCPFHENTKTKAAKFFKEEHNEHIYCFAEGKQYKPHHLLTNNIVHFSVNHVFSAIWGALSDSEKSIFSDDFSQYKIIKDHSPYYLEYKKGKISYFELLRSLRST